MQKIINYLKQNPYIGFFIFFIIIRTSLDYFGDFQVFNIDSYNISVNLASLLAILFIGVYTPVVIKNRRFFKRKHILLFLILILWLAATTFFSFSKIDSIKEVLRLIDIFIAFFVGYVFFDNLNKFKILILGILISSIMPELIGYYQLASGHFYVPQINDTDFGANRIQGTFGHPNPFSFYLYFAIVLSIISYKSKSLFNSLRIKKYTMFVGIVSLILIIFTFTRNTWAALMLFLAAYIFLYNKRALLMLFITSLASYILIPSIQERILDIFSNPFNSLIWRLNLWYDMFVIALTKPLFGWGVGTFPDVTEYFRGINLGSLEAHNDYLKMFLESGIVGLALFLILIGFMFYLLIKYYIGVKNQDFKNILLLSGVFFISIFIVSFSDNVLRVTAFQIVFWAYFGSLLRVSEEPKIEKLIPDIKPIQSTPYILKLSKIKKARLPL